jgi:hypothetical protein
VVAGLCRRLLEDLGLVPALSQEPLPPTGERRNAGLCDVSGR